jgi:predicted nuclease of predicted toxin-antitoxin system
MATFLVDANLPYYFSIWNHKKFVHVRDIDDSMSDEEIWNYALEHKLIILTKDADFSSKVLLKGSPPKVIHFRFGNLRMHEFHALLTKIWDDLELLIQDNSLVNVYLDRIESIK